MIRILWVAWMLGISVSGLRAAEEWKTFFSGLEEVGVSLGVGPSYAILGSRTAHDLAIAKFHYGRVLTDTWGKKRWWAGNFEFVAELLGGAQWYPEDHYITAFGPFLRYNLATGKRWVPFVDAGAGITLTDIGEPDLGGTFQFNLQAGIGTHIFVNRNTAVTMQCRYIHISNAGIQLPNGGANATIFSVGVSWFF